MIEGGKSRWQDKLLESLRKSLGLFPRPLQDQGVIAPRLLHTEPVISNFFEL
ncbi:MAG: hypothetical protein IIA23_08595 [Chloroflexi bacterium]|nr:hypothetical protein [Chloroflexota bacterium]